MTVSGNAVSLHALINLAEQARNLCTSACTGGAGFCINNDGIRIDDAFLHQRIGAQEGAGRITARVRDESRALDLFAVNLRQSVNGFTDKLRGCMFDLVPFLINVHIFDTEVSA